MGELDAGACLTSAGLFEYEEYISLKTINDPNEGYVFVYLTGRMNVDASIVMRPLQIS